MRLNRVEVLETTRRFSALSGYSLPCLGPFPYGSLFKRKHPPTRDTEYQLFRPSLTCCDSTKLLRVFWGSMLIDQVINLGHSDTVEHLKCHVLSILVQKPRGFVASGPLRNEMQ